MWHFPWIFLIFFIEIAKSFITCGYGPISGIAIFSGPVNGTVLFSQASCTSNVTVSYSLVGLSPGYHGFHVHEKGDTRNNCANTLGHYNPYNVSHGGPNDRVRHVGDLGNIYSNDDLIASGSFVDSIISLYNSKSILGRAVVIHAKPDDLGKGNNTASMANGNAGSRVTCAIIGIA